MARTYTARARADATARTRERILETARRLVPESTQLPVDHIAAQAGVSVQTLYTHFGSKRGLLLAVIDSMQREVGLYADFDRVWASPDGETALRRMIEATVRLWHGAWPLVAFSERARRTDAEIGTYLREVDGYRLANLRSITDRLAEERRLRDPLDTAAASELAFALSVPSVYEWLVVVRGWKPSRATSVIVETACTAVIDPSTTPLLDPPPDWSAVLRPTDAAGLESGRAATE